jgi:hypothetical protein
MMNKKRILISSLVLGILCWAGMAMAQFNHPFPNFGAQSTTVPAVGSITYFDDGGQFGNYSPNHNHTTASFTFQPSTPGAKVNVQFVEFNTEANFDALYVHDGANTAAPLIASGNGAPIGGPAPAGPAGGWWGNGIGLAPNNQGAGVVRATPGNASGALTFTFRSDGSVQFSGWQAIVTEFIGCSPLTQDITISTDPGICTATANVNFPTFNPAGCANQPGFFVRYAVNGGPWIVVNQPYPANISIPGLTGGNNTVEWQTMTGTATVVGAVIQNIFVQDLEAPVLNCPSDIIVNLNPGLCCAFVSWAEPTATDNCPFVEPGEITFFPPSFVAHGAGQAFTLQGNTFSQGNYFNLTNNHTGPVEITGIGVRFPNPAFGATPPPRTFNIWTAPSFVGIETNMGAWTNIGSVTVTVVAPYFAAGTGDLTLLELPSAVNIPAGGTSGFHIYSANTGLVFNYTFGQQAPVTNGDFTFTGGPVSFGELFNLFNPGANAITNINVHYNKGGDAVIVQTGGPLSGEELCYEDGPWVVSYETEDIQGNVGTCEFTIEILPFANPKLDLTCNDQVQISLGENCDTPLGADDILEGGPYSCYDDYVVMILGPNGQPLPNSPVLGRNNIGQCYTVKVTDPTTGNSCWSEICVEDKWPPTMICTDLELPCGADIPLAPSPFFFAEATPLEQNVPFTNFWTGYAFNLDNVSGQSIQITGLEIQASLAGNPAGNYNVRIFMRDGSFVGNTNSAAGWTEVGNQDVNITAGFPTVLLYEIPFLQNYEIQGGSTAGVAVYVNNGNGFGTRVVAQIGTAPTTDGILTINQNPGRWLVPVGANGFWTGEAFPGENPRPQLKVFYAEQADPILVTDNCTPESFMNTVGQGLSFGDDIVNYTCAENDRIHRTIFRVWTATDEQGNSTQCVQRIDIRRASVSSLELPPNFDDIDEESFDCTEAYPTPEYINSARGTGGFPAGGGCGSLQFEYWDKVLQVCQGSYTIIRTWKIHDMCTGDIAEVDQVIKVTDKTPPLLFCPAEHDIKVGGTKKAQKGCTANVMMPWIQVTDDCSTTNNITFYVWTTLPDGSLVIVNTMNAQGFFVFDLPVGFTYTFIYTAIDDCGNKAECSVDVLVRDQVPPVVICETFHVVALTDSVTLVNAISFDDGSYDDCGPVTFAARRGTMNAAGNFVQHPCNQPGDFLYQPQVRFYCCDIQSPIEVWVDLRVRDVAGNDNFCMVQVEIVDKIRPVIWCPDDITVQCGMPFEPTDVDTFNICIQPNQPIKDAFAAAYPLTIDIFGIPADARITDLDLSLNINHAVTNDLRVTLYSPLGRKAEVLTPNSCAGQPVQNPWDIDVTFNDQAYNIAVFNATGQRVAAPFTCTSAKPSIGAFNQGQMKPQGDELKIFNGETLNSFTNKNLCYTVGANDITVATNRMSNFQVQLFIQNAGLLPGDRILLEYASATGQAIDGLTVGNVYLFQVINNNTIELLTVGGADILSVAAGSQHMFCASGTWLLVVEDTKPLGGGVINEVCLHIGYVLPTGLKPIATDNTEACGLDFSHQDLGQPDKCANNTFINRRWRVDDKFGNNSTCIQRVYFRDDTPLTVQFPCDVTIQCQNLDDLDATGDVRHNGDCELVAVSHTDQVLVTTDACFKVLRTWTVIDWCKYQDDGNVDYPTTSINEALNQITFSTAINALINSRRIEIGDRVTLRYVTSGTTEIPGLVEGDIYSMVRISGTTFRVDYNTTKQQAVNITGQGVGPHIFRYANSDRGLPITCDVLQEWYPFVEWYTACCNPIAVRRAWEDDGDGYFKFTQEIKVVDNQAPQWVDCSDKEFCSFEADCGPTFIELICPAVDNCTPEDQLKYTYFIDAFNDGTIDIEGIGNDASGAYPLGTHKITFKVTDQCGNWNTCTKLFTITDCKKPTPICINGLSVDLMATPNGGMAEIWAKSLEAGDSHDNCTSYENLIILVERLSEITPGQDQPGPTAGMTVTVTCDDLPPVAATPIVDVVVWVGDEAGNWDYCITTIWVQDNMDACEPGQSTSLFTHITNEDQEGVELVNVGLSGGANQMLVSNEAGQAQFGNLLSNTEVTVTPEKDINPLNGVSTYDLLLIQKHLLGVKALNSPYKLIAADVNNSGTITISDIIELRKMILTPGLDFTNNTSWRFVDAGYVFPNPTKPFNFPEMKSMMLTPNANTANFIGMKIGDVSGDHTPNTLLGGEVRNVVGDLTFAVADQTLTAGQEYTVAITAENFRQIQGYQYTLDFDGSALEFVSVDAVWSDLSASNFGRAKVSEGILTTSWNSSEGVTLTDGEVLYTVTFRAKANMQLSQALTVNSRVTKAEAYDGSEELLDVSLRFDGVVTGGEFALYQNEPNPFRDITIIGFNLPETTTATLKVFDVTGKVVKVVTGEFAKGYNTINLTRADIRGNGMLYYQLETATDSATKRMILVD